MIPDVTIQNLVLTGTERNVSRQNTEKGGDVRKIKINLLLKKAKLQLVTVWSYTENFERTHIRLVQVVLEVYADSRNTVI